MLTLPYRNMTIAAASRVTGINKNRIRRAIDRGCPTATGRRGPWSAQDGLLIDPSEVRLYLGPRSDKRKLFKDGIDLRPGFIYGIYEPGVANPRYVGKTDNLNRRWKGHLAMWRGKAHRGCKSYVFNWLRSLHKRGIKPVFKVLQECLPGMMNAAEQEWIARGKAKGWRLVNSTSGGEACEMAESTRRRLSEYSKAKWKDPEYVKRWEKGTKHLRLSPDVVAEREATHQRNRAIHARNMEIAADRKADRESFKTLTYLCHQHIAFVPLTNGLYARIDKADMDKVIEHVWHAVYKGGKPRAKRSFSDGSCQLLHRFILNANDGQIVRFADRDWLNCTRANMTLIEQRAGRPALGWS